MQNNICHLQSCNYQGKHPTCSVRLQYVNRRSPMQAAVMCPSHFCRVRVESESRALRVSRVRVIINFVESESSHELVESSHKNGRITSNHWFTSSSQYRVIQNFKLFLYIFGYRSTSGPSIAIGPLVDFQWL